MPSPSGSGSTSAWERTSRGGQAEECHRDEQVHLDMFEDVNVAGNRKRNWRITYPDGWTLDFVGFMSRWQEEAFDATGDAKEHLASYRISIDGEVAAAMNTP